MAKTAFIVSDRLGVVPNLARERELLLADDAPDVTLMLWQSDRVVVIGAEQDPAVECDLARMEDEGVPWIRRASGGGAVYQDMGNLNFSFIVCDALYDVNRQLGVIAEALASFGVVAAATGRNDLSVGDRKVSGSAFFHGNGRWIHHGTLLVNVDLAAMQRYLTPPPEKLSRHSVTSVGARVANLADYNPQITVSSLTSALESAFAAEYGAGR